jgi:hypothetical protein
MKVPSAGPTADRYFGFHWPALMPVEARYAYPCENDDDEQPRRIKKIKHASEHTRFRGGSALTRTSNATAFSVMRLHLRIIASMSAMIEACFASFPLFACRT